MVSSWFHVSLSLEEEKGRGEGRDETINFSKGERKKKRRNNKRRKKKDNNNKKEKCERRESAKQISKNGLKEIERKLLRQIQASLAE